MKTIIPFLSALFLLAGLSAWTNSEPVRCDLEVYVVKIDGNAHPIGVSGAEITYGEPGSPSIQGVAPQVTNLWGFSRFAIFGEAATTYEYKARIPQYYSSSAERQLGELSCEIRLAVVRIPELQYFIQQKIQYQQYEDAEQQIQLLRTYFPEFSEQPEFLDIRKLEGEIQLKRQDESPIRSNEASIDPPPLHPQMDPLVNPGNPDLEKQTEDLLNGGHTTLKKEGSGTQ